MLKYGCTRLEIGVQSVYEDVARDTNRGHTVRAVAESFQMSKDAGFKVVAHMMPDLPNVDIDRDVDQFVVSSVYITYQISACWAFLFCNQYTVLLATKQLNCCVNNNIV